MPPFIELVGRRFGMLVVERRDGVVVRRHGGKKPESIVAWICRCDCGGEKRVAGHDLRARKATSCGCTSKRLFEFHGERLTTDEISRRLGRDRNLVAMRLRKGWSFEQAVGEASPPVHPPSRRSPLSDLELFSTHVERSEGCWRWTGALDDKGYGVSSRRGVKPKKIRANRHAWLLNVGPIPDGLHVLHKCDNPPCVRPDHLFLGTNTDNCRDKIAKGREAAHVRKGAGHWASKLTKQDVIAVRFLLAMGHRKVDLARAFGVSGTAIRYVEIGKNWGHFRPPAATAEFPEART